MRLRLRGLFKGRSTKSLIGLSVVGLIVLCVAGGGAYAALGGTIRQSSSSDIELQRGLVSWYKMDGNAKDAMPKANNASTVFGNFTADRKGKAAGAYTSDGLTQFVSIPDANSLDTASVSVSLWVKVNAVTDCDANNNWRALIRKGAGAGTIDGWDIVLEQNGDTFWDVGLAGSSSRLGAASGLTLGSTKLITATYDAATGSQKFYVNGVLLNSKSNTPTPVGVNTQALNIALGAHSGACPNTDGYAPATYDDVRIYDRAVTAAEAKALYESYDSQINAGSGQGGLVGHWKFDGNAKDATPNADNGTVTGATLTTDRKDRANSAYSFNGTFTSYIRMATTRLPDPHTAHSGEAWIYPTADNGTIMDLSLYTAGAMARLKLLGGVIKIEGNGITKLTGTRTVSYNQWHHVAYTYAGGAVGTFNNQFCVYLDGTLDVCGNQGIDGGAGSPDGFWIGKDSGNNNYFTGKIDDVHLFTRVLSAGEIKQQYESYDSQINLNSTPTNTTSGGNINQGLVAYWPFSGNAKDSTPYANNGTVNNAVLGADRQGNANSAYTFNGTNADIRKTSGLSGFPALNQAQAVVAWFKIPSTATTEDILTLTTGTTGNQYRIIGSFLGIGMWAGGHYATGSTAITTNVWHHAAYTYDGTTWKLYLDGSLDGSATTAPQTGSPTAIYIGSFGAGEWLNGSIDGVRLYNRALSATEVQTLYASPN